MSLIEIDPPSIHIDPTVRIQRYEWYLNISNEFMLVDGSLYISWTRWVGVLRSDSEKRLSRKQSLTCIKLVGEKSPKVGINGKSRVSFQRGVRPIANIVRRECLTEGSKHKLPRVISSCLGNIVTIHRLF